MGDIDKKTLYPGWETVRKIGTGSFGTVYEIERDLFGKKEKAALKLISIPQNESDIDELYGNGFDDASITAHFQNYLADIVREYSLMAEMKGHTNVVYCDDIRYVQHDDGFGWDIYIKMELLTPMMKALGKEVTDEQVIKLGRDICNALVLCKSRNIIHRDIKPQNIFISNDGDYKLGDFGIAKTAEKTSGGTKIGTYNYMAPEVYNNEPYGHAADIYSLGLVMYWLLNERRMPFNPLPPAVPTASEMDEARLRRFQGEPIPAPAHGSGELKQIVLKACAYDPKERYQSAAEMLSALESIGKPVRQDPVRPEQQAEEEKAAENGERNERTQEQEEDKTAGIWAKQEREPEPEEDKTAGVWTRQEKKPEKDKTVSAWANQKKESEPDDARTVRACAAPSQSQAAPAPTPEKKSGKKKIIGIIAACLIFAVCVGFAIGRNNAGKAETPAASVKETEKTADVIASSEEQTEDTAPRDETRSVEEIAKEYEEKKGQTVLKCAFSSGSTHPEMQTLKKISVDLYDATDGRYSIEVYPEGQLGDQARTLEQVSLGNLDMTLVTNTRVQIYAPDFYIFATPYIFDSLAHQQRVFESGQLEDLYSETEPQGFSVLGSYCVGTRDIYSNTPITSPADLAGKRINVMGGEKYENMINVMGGEAVQFAPSDVYDAIQFCMVDGAENFLTTYMDVCHYEVALFYNRTEHLMTPDELCISEGTLSAMSGEDREALKKVCTEAVSYCYKLCAELRSEYEAKAEAWGVIFVDADVSAFQARCQTLIEQAAGMSDMTKQIYELIVSLR